jgi:hypothetical protein
MSIVYEIIARLLTDETFRAMVQNHGEAALRIYNLTAHELAVITQLNLDQWGSKIAEILPGPLEGVRVRS